MKIVFKVIQILIGTFFSLVFGSGMAIMIGNGFDLTIFIVSIISFVLGISLISSGIKKKDSKKVLDIVEPLDEVKTDFKPIERIDFSKKSEMNNSKQSIEKKKARETIRTHSNIKESQKAYPSSISTKSIQFGLWDSNIHSSKEQNNRIKRAINQVSKPLSIDVVTKTAEFLGSEGELYNTSLDSCDCMDFLTRKLPCKHIYKLAIELGEYVVVSNSTTNSRLPKDKNLIKDEISKLSFTSKSILRNLCYLSIYQNVHGVFLDRHTFPFELIKKGFCVEVADNISDYVVPNVRADLINLIYSSNLKTPPKERAITRTVQSYIQNLDEDNMELYKNNIILISLSNNAKGIVRSIFSYLN